MTREWHTWCGWWVHRQGPATLDEIHRTVPVDPATLEDALSLLAREGRVEARQEGSAIRYAARDCLIPIGDSAGWEAAIFDHYQALVVSICTKLRRGSRRTEAGETIGGSTYGFTVWPGHPHHDEVTGLLSRLRRDVAELRRKVHEYNQNEPGPEHGRIGVIAYLGQTLVETEYAEDDRR